MLTLKGFNSLSDSEIKILAKEHDSSPEFLGFVLTNKEMVLGRLIKCNALRSGVINSFNESEDIGFLAQEMISNGFVPHEDFIVRLLTKCSNGGKVAETIIKTFPDMSITQNTLVALANAELVNVCADLFSLKKNLQTKDIAATIIKLGGMNSELDMFGSKVPEIVDLFYGKDFSYNKSEIPTQITRAIIETYGDTLTLESLHGLRLDKAGLESILKKWEILKLNSDKRSYGRRVDTTLRFQWHPEYEELDEDDYRFRGAVFAGAPAHSKFRKNLITEVPSEASDEELVEITNGSNYKNELKRLLSECTKRGSQFLENIELSRFETLTPAELRDVVHGEEAGMYLFKKLSHKYTSALKTKLPKEFVEANTKKTSRYEDVYQAILSGNIDEMRTICSGKYTLEKFANDTHQTSKSQRASDLSTVSGFFEGITKEELLILAASNIRLNGIDFEKHPNLKLNEDEYLLLLDKKQYDTHLVFHLIDIPKAIKNGIVPSEIVCNFIGDCLENKSLDPEIDKAVVEAIRLGKSEYRSSDCIKFLAKRLLREDIISIFDDFMEFSNSEIMNVKDIKGRYIVANEDLKFFISTKDIENSDVLRNILERDPDLLKELILKYNKGTKDLNSFLGSTTNIKKRMKIEIFKNYAQQMEGDKSNAVNLLLSGKIGLYKFKNEVLDWKNCLKEIASRNIPIKLDKLNVPSYDDEIEFIEHGIKFETEILSFEGGHRYFNVEEFKGFIENKSILFNKIQIGEKFGVAREVLRYIDTQSYEVISDSPVVITTLASFGIVFANTDEFWTQSFELIVQDPSVLRDIEFLDIMVKKGLIVDDKTVKALLESKYDWQSIDIELIQALRKYHGPLDSFTIVDAKVLEKERLLALETGLNLVSATEYSKMEIINNLKALGKNFPTIDVSPFSNTIKSMIISFIEENIDERFKDLKLKSMNLGEIDSIDSYEVMREIYSPADHIETNLFKIPKNILSNKKMLDGIQTYLRTNVKLPFKVKLLLELAELLGVNGDMSFDDFFEYTNYSDISESDSLRRINISSLSMFLEAKISEYTLLKQADKSKFLRFLRSCSGENDSYLNDVFQMAETAINGIKAIDERLKILDPKKDSENIQNLQIFRDGVLGRFNEILAMDDVTHVHDRLVTLLAFVKNDGTQPLGQDKFKRLEKDQPIAKSLGYRLFFPKVRADLTTLGNEHGWCVNTNPAYANDIISKGNIMVGVYPTNGSFSYSAIVALAHFKKDNSGNYYLAEFKWSKNIHGYQQDCTSEINHALILDLLNSEIKLIAQVAESEEQKAA